MMMTIYGILSVGIHIHAHYCCGKLSNIDFFEPIKKCCAHHEDSDEGLSFKKNCCDFERYDLMLDESHQASSFKLVFPALISEKLSYVAFAFDKEIFAEENHPLSDTGPPLAVPLFIRHQSLVLYA